MRSGFPFIVSFRAKGFRVRYGRNDYKTKVLPYLVLLAVLLHARGGDAFLIGDVDVTPRVELEGVYDDNVFLRNENDAEGPIQGDWFGRIRPGILLSYDRGPTDFSLGYRNEFLFYDRLTERDNYGRNHSLSFSAGHDFGERTSLSLTDSLMIGSDVSEISETGLTDVEQLGILPRQRDYRRNRASIEITRAVTRRVQITVHGVYGYSWYDSIVQQGVEEEPQTEEHQGNVSAAGSFAWHRRNSVNASLQFSYMDFDQRGDSKTYQASLGNSWQITEAFTVQGSAGIEYLQETRSQLVGPGESSQEESFYPYGNLTGTYIIQRLELFVSLLYGLRDSSGLGTTVTSRSVRFGFDYNPVDPLMISAFGFYSKSKSADDAQGLDMESLQGGCSLQYELFSWASVNVRYNYIDQKSIGDPAEAFGETYKDNRFTIGWILTLPDTVR